MIFCPPQVSSSVQSHNPSRARSSQPSSDCLASSIPHFLLNDVCQKTQHKSDEMVSGNHQASFTVSIPDCWEQYYQGVHAYFYLIVFNLLNHFSFEDIYSCFLILKHHLFQSYYKGPKICLQVPEIIRFQFLKGWRSHSLVSRLLEVTL